MEQPGEASEEHQDFRVVPGPFYTPTQLSLARRHRHAENAIAAMGEGMVLAQPDARLVAFHEKHLTILQRQANLQRT